MGDIASANRFDQLALHTRKDLDVIRSSLMRGDTVPRWKNEMRTFSIVKYANNCLFFCILNFVIIVLKHMIETGATLI